MTNDWPAGVHRLMQALADAAPPAPSSEELGTRAAPSTQRRSLLALTVLASLVAATIATLIAVAVRLEPTTQDEGPAPTSLSAVPTTGPSAGTTPSATVQVRHDRIEATITYDLQCDTPIPTDGLFSTITVDVYADLAGRRWKNVVTYPDGSTRELVAVGSAFYPTELWTRGTIQGVTPGRIGPDEDNPLVLVAEPGQNDFYTLTPAADFVDDEAGYVQGISERATRLDQQQPDLQGRLGTVWKQQIDGTTELGPSSYPIHQTTTWWVDPADGTTITQYQFTNTVDGLGTAQSTQVLISRTIETVTDDFFDTSGYDAQPTLPKPTLNDTSAFSTTEPLRPTSAASGSPTTGP